MDEGHTDASVHLSTLSVRILDSMCTQIYKNTQTVIMTCFLLVLFDMYAEEGTAGGVGKGKRIEI